MWRRNSKESSENNAKHQITDAKISENTKQEIKNSHTIFIIGQNGENQNEETIVKAARGKKLCTEE